MPLWEVDQQGQMSDATALKILNRLNTEMEVLPELSCFHQSPCESKLGKLGTETFTGTAERGLSDCNLAQAADQLRQLLHRLGSPFVSKLVYEMAKATIHYRFQARNFITFWKRVPQGKHINRKTTGRQRRRRRQRRQPHVTSYEGRR